MDKKKFVWILVAIFLVLLIAIAFMEEKISNVMSLSEEEIVEDDADTDFLLPEIYIICDINAEDIDRYEYSDCLCTITNTKEDNCLKEVSGQIRGRGNSTWNEFDKKPYKLKFNEKQDLFGMGEDKDWILLSNAVDYTLMRNEIAFELGTIFELQYTSKCQWVQLFINDEYEGIYLLCEQVETGINRVNIEIPFDQEDIDISFFLELGGELDGFALPAVENAENNWDDYFSCEIVYPEAELVTKNQKEYIEVYLQLVNSAILTKNWNEIIELVDIDSFANWYLVNEIMLNGDMGWSMFAYKPKGEKLYLGPVWDFDQSCGVSGTGGAEFTTWYPDTSSQNAWFNTLIEMEEFRTLLAEKWREKKPEVESFLMEEKEKAIIYQYDIDANYERWPVLGTASWRIREEIGALKTYEENTEFLFIWLENRMKWIDTELSSY